MFAFLWQFCGYRRIFWEIFIIYKMHDITNVFLLKYFLVYRIKIRIPYEENQCLLIGLNTHRESF